VNFFHKVKPNNFDDFIPLAPSTVIFELFSSVDKIKALIIHYFVDLHKIKPSTGYN